MLYPSSLPHGNDEFYDSDWVSSASFLMQSLLNDAMVILKESTNTIWLMRIVLLEGMNIANVNASYLSIIEINLWSCSWNHEMALTWLTVFKNTVNQVLE